MTLLVLLPWLAAACMQVDRFNDPNVSNKSGITLTISYIHNGQTTPMDITMLDDHLVPLSDFRDGCSDGILLALDPAGREFVRHEAPLCAGEIWTIGPAASASP